MVGSRIKGAWQKVDLGIPIWGQYSLFGLSVGVNLMVMVAILRGGLVTEKRQDQINAQHAAELAETNERHASELAAERVRTQKWQEAWQAGQNLASQQMETVSRLTNIAEVLEKVLTSLPPLAPLPTSPEGDHDG